MEKPDVNAIIDTETNEFIYHDYADISIAISTPNGLVVPPVHNVESLNFAEVELSIKALAKKAREGSLTLSEMSGGTFTITNGGIFGSLQSTSTIGDFGYALHPRTTNRSEWRSGHSTDDVCGVIL
jgi:2-oxoglutarate dehydrogenase E2 component (dihydrolipoamide succinyltransferase)